MDKTARDLTDLLGADLEELSQLLEGFIDRPFRVRQLFDAIHRRAVTSLQDVTDLPQGLRNELAGQFTIARPEIVQRAESRDGTIRYVLRLADGAQIEMVSIPQGRRTTLCVSSQAGCALGCRFCVTGYWGAGRNLTAAEIVGQVLLARDEIGPERSRQLNLVLMGMGEPLHNLEAVHKALLLVTITIPWRRITLSTAGVAPGIEALGRWPQRPNLALSLHAADDELRTRLLPINRKYPLGRLREVLESYPLERSRRLTFEVTLIRGVNDSDDCARSLARWCHGFRCKVNLIPLNPDPVLVGLERPEARRIRRFRELLQERGVAATVRRPRGDDVGAACGQLRAEDRTPRGFREPLRPAETVSLDRAR